MTARSVIISTIDQLEAQAASKHADALALLKVIQARLGTDDEQTNDLDAVQQIAHQMRSTETVLFNAHRRLIEQGGES